MFSTNDLGEAYFPITEDGEYSVTFAKEGFIKSEFNIEIMAGTVFFNRFSVSPRLPIGAIRIVLDWGEKPCDLDAHFIKQTAYHISYCNMKVSADGISRLDRDDTDSFGPETITSNRIDADADYSYFIHDYTNRSRTDSSSLSESKACVKVFGGNEMLDVFNITPGNTGTYWHVLDVIDGQVVMVDKVMNISPSN